MEVTIPITIEVCPECGKFCERLNETTGFCFACSPESCARCGGFANKGHNYCIRCQREIWLERNADRMEFYLSQGLGILEAKQRVNCENRAICISCSQPIPGRSRQTTIFCSRTKRCRTAKRKYLWQIEKGVERDLALEKVLEEQLREES